MSIIGLDDRGQISAELLLLLVVVLVIIGSITIPLIGNSIDASNAVSAVSDAKSAVVSIADAVNIVYANGPGAKRTLDVYSPQAGNVVGNNNLLGMTVTGLNYTLSNGSTSTTRFVNSTIDYNGTISSPLSKGWNRIQVYWAPNNNTISITKL